MIRSAEVMRAKGEGKKPPKVIAHIEIHPAMGGGVRVEHHHTEPMHHPPAIHEFKAGDHEGFMEHIDEHAGMEGPAGGAEAHSNKATGYPEAE